ncbi:nuclease-related domain-containing protein [Paraburkholderia mimosarum]|uniref:nuclease-related domain-containing protein n=1 Tax=Paraburkholderia mimosarum TaxID=312026 RepID=UPI00041E9C82|nr:nuclease-related domain-containing protein [Paraburkholderia mimosarum]
MTAFIVLAILAYIGYRYSKRGARRKTGWRFFGPAYVPDRGEPFAPPATRASQRGEAGEAAVHAELHRVLTWLCGDDFHLHDGPVLIEHAPGTAFPTAEIDHLAVTPFGIFVIETKNWTGRIAHGAGYDDLDVIRPDGTRETRRSPLAQNRTKVAFLNEKLPRLWRIEGLGVFAAAACTLDRDLPPTLLHVSELAYFLRMRRHEFLRSGQKPVNVKTAWGAIMLNASISKTKLEEHVKRLRVNPKVCPVGAE